MCPGSEQPKGETQTFKNLLLSQVMLPGAPKPFLGRTESPDVRLTTGSEKEGSRCGYT